jgi:hypothetical protein
MTAIVAARDVDVLVRDLMIDFGPEGAARHATNQALNELDRGRVLVAQRWRRVLNAINRLA